MTTIPRWAFERVEMERAAFLGAEYNPANIDVIMNNPEGWQPYHVFAAFIARTMPPPSFVHPINIVYECQLCGREVPSGTACDNCHPERNKPC